MPDRSTSAVLPALTRSRRFRLLALITALGAATSVAVGLTAAPAHAAAPQTVVSLTFDDGNADQVAAAATLASNGLRGTFFVNSGFLGASGYMTTAQVKQLAADGHEIGGHTVSHPDLTAISSAEAKRQICLDRANLSALGVSVTDFAYPFASETAAVRNLVSQCGYNSARGLGDLKSRFGCDDCDVAESIPPQQPFITEALDEVDASWTLKDLQDPVIAAEAQGGWVQYTFHHICSSSCDLNITPALLAQFAKWLADRKASTGGTTTVKTVAQVINKAAKAVVQPSYPAPAASGVNALKNPGLETVPAGTDVPSCYLKGGYGANTPTFSLSSAAHAGTKAEQLSMANYSDGDAKLLPNLDLGDCAPTVVPGRSYSLREWYQSSAVTQFAVYLRDSGGTWRYWTSSPWYAASSTWVNATWTTPAIPSGTTGLSFGLNLFNNGTLVTDDFAMYDSTGAPVAATAMRSARAADPTGAKPHKIRGQQKKGTIQAFEGARREGTK